MCVGLAVFEFVGRKIAPRNCVTYASVHQHSYTFVAFKTCLCHRHGQIRDSVVHGRFCRDILGVLDRSGGLLEKITGQHHGHSDFDAIRLSVYIHTLPRCSRETLEEKIRYCFLYVAFHMQNNWNISLNGRQVC